YESMTWEQPKDLTPCSSGTSRDPAGAADVWTQPRPGHSCSPPPHAQPLKGDATMIRWFLGVSLAAGLAALVPTAYTAAQANGPQLEFQPFTSEAGRFTVELPGKPLESSKDIGSGMKQYSFVVAIV